MQMTGPLENLLSDAGMCPIFRRIGVIGDSLSSGEHESLIDGQIGWHDYYEYSWGQFMARACGSTVYNFSCGGLMARDFLLRIREPRFNIWDPQQRCQAYIIALGVNEILHNLRGEMYMGTVSDIHPDAPEKNAATFCGYMGRILSALKVIKPKCRIFLMTMPRGIAEPLQPLEKLHAQLIREMAKLFDFTYVIDFYEHACVYDEEFRRVYYVGDHLNAMGYLLTAKMTMTYIDHIIRENPADFAQVGFIGREQDMHHEKYVW